MVVWTCLTRGEGKVVCGRALVRPSSSRTTHASCLGVPSTRPPGFPRRHPRGTDSGISVQRRHKQNSRDISSRSDMHTIRRQLICRQLMRDLHLCSFDSIFSARLAAAMNYMCTKFAINSSSRFYFTARTVTHTDKVTDVTDHLTHAPPTAGTGNCN